jgi:hypothetical protein
MKSNSNSSSVFGLAAILVFLTLPVLAQAPAGVPSLDEMAGDWLPMKGVANPPDVNNFRDMLMINRDLTSFFCNPDDWLWGWGDGKWKAGYPLVTLAIAGNEYPAAEVELALSVSGSLQPDAQSWNLIWTWMPV